MPKTTTEQISDLLMEIGFISGHVENSTIVGITYNTNLGKTILKAVKSIEHGFSRECVPFITSIANSIEKESPEVQQKFNQMLSLISNGDAELVRQYRMREVESLNRRISRLVTERDSLLQSLGNPLTIENLRNPD